jgi:hypothetical protein
MSYFENISSELLVYVDGVRANACHSERFFFVLKDPFSSEWDIK